MMTSQQIEQNLRGMSPHLEQHQKRLKPRFIAAQNLVDISIPPQKKITIANPDRKLTLLPFHWWRPIIPAFCSTKSLRRRGKPLGSPCAKNSSVIRGYFWPKNQTLSSSPTIFFQTLSSQTLVNRFF